MAHVWLGHLAAPHPVRIPARLQVDFVAREPVLPSPQPQ
jgi:hypothetical protein